MNKDIGRLPDGTGLSQPEPEVSALRASIPSADAWRTDSPPFGKRPIWQYVWLQGYSYHSGHYWDRQGWGTAGIRTNDAEDGLLGYRRSDIERICKDNDIDLISVRLVGWLPMTPPATLRAGERASLAPCDDGEWAASAIEAQRAETPESGSVHESAVAKPDAHDQPA
jgi:hypothetical protein